MKTEAEASFTETQFEFETEQIIEIRDPEIDVERVMARIRANIARRRAEGAYEEDLDAIAAEVFAGVVSESSATESGEGVLALTLSQLDSQWMIREQPFVSRAPILGSLIVAVRNLWNWMSTKWYVQSLFQQQVGFNALAVRAFHEMNTEHRLLAERFKQLEEQHKALIKSNLQLRSELEELTGAELPAYELEGTEQD